MVWFDVCMSIGHDVHLSVGHDVHLVVVILHRFGALPENFLETEEISRRFVLLPEVFLDTVRSSGCVHLPDWAVAICFVSA